MKPILKFVACILLTGFLFFISCQKELSCENFGSNPPAGGTNKFPIANAGADQTIILPKDSIVLDGSLSSDQNGTIISYYWTRISGPASFNIANPNTVQTRVTNLVQGTYQFELKVTDAGSLFSKDTIHVTVNPESPPPNTCSPGERPIIAAQLIPFGALSISRNGMTVATAGNKIVFAGGSDGNGDESSRVDIYDMVSQTWATAELSSIKSHVAAVTLGNKIFFAGGHTVLQNSWELFATVDIYDASANT